MSEGELTGTTDACNSVFWHDEQNWPDDAPTHQFLGRAVLKIARLRYGDDWQVPGAPLRRSWARRGFKLRRNLDIIEAQDLLRLMKLIDWPLLRDNQSAADIVARILDVSFDPDHRLRLYQTLASSISEPTWRAVCNLALTQVEEQSRKIGEWNAVKDDVVRALREGGVETRLRPRLGGDPEPAPKGIWVTEYSRQMRRLDSCRISRTAPFDPPDKHAEYIFVDQDELVAAAMRFGAVVASEPPKLPDASDYMEAMLHVWHYRFQRAAYRYRATDVQNAIRKEFSDRGLIDEITGENKTPNQGFVEHVTQLIRGFKASKGGKKPLEHELT